MSTSVTAVFDLDRTVTRDGTYTPFLLHCAPSGPLVAVRVAVAAAAALAYTGGLITRGALKARMLDLFIAGASREQVAAWADDFVDRWLVSRVRPGALNAIARHRAAGHRLVLATASFDFYAETFAKRLGFDDVIATKSVWDSSGKLCAALDGENCYGPAKLGAVRNYFAAQTSQSRIVAYSDHHSDLGLLQWAHEGVAVNPNKKLRHLAPAHNLAVVDWDRTENVSASRPTV
jgi:HAD superfamily hydrolase (TIGR01490 family)